MKMSSLMERFEVPALETGYIIGDLKFSNLVSKNHRINYPEYDVLIANPVFYFDDQRFENALKSRTFFSKDGNECIRLVFKDYGSNKHLPIMGNAENGAMTTADKLLINNDYQSYLLTNQKVLACVRSYEYNNKYGSGVTHSLSYLEIDSIEHPKIS